VNIYAKDGNGFVSRVSAKTKQVELEWLRGLNSPTGLSVHEGLLYVVDFDALVIADISTGKIIQRVDSPHKKPALNDVAVSASGRVFVSGSASKSIYELKNDRLEVWMQDDELLFHANGLLIDGSHLIHGGAIWSVFDLKTKQLLDTGLQKKPDLKEFDGITSDGCGGYLVTLLDDARIWRITNTGNAAPLSELKIDGIDLHRVGSRLYVPTVGKSLEVFELPEGLCEESATQK
jgi:hypothetical protein